MNMVKTYEMVGLTCCGEAWQELEEAKDFRGNPDESGDWVSFADYESLRIKYQELQTAVRKLFEASQSQRSSKP
jgi:hypothetical protein